MSNGWVLCTLFQVSLRLPCPLRPRVAQILKYPPKVVAMFNHLKGHDNLKTYDKTWKLICKDNGWPYSKSAANPDARYGTTCSILDAMNSAKPLASARTVGAAKGVAATATTAAGSTEPPSTETSVQK